MFLTLFTVGIFGAAWPKRSLFPKILHAHPVTMKLGTVIPYLKKSENIMNHVKHPLDFADISIFSPELSNFCYVILTQNL